MAMRSWLFVPADSEKKIAKAIESEADAIIFVPQFTPQPSPTPSPTIPESATRTGCGRRRRR